MSLLAYVGKIYSYEKTSISLFQLKKIIENLPNNPLSTQITLQNISEEYNNLNEDLEMNIPQNIKPIFTYSLKQLQYLIPKIKNNDLRNYFKKEIDLENTKILIKGFLVGYQQPQFLKNGLIDVGVFEKLLESHNLNSAVDYLISLGVISSDPNEDYEKSIWRARLDLFEQCQKSNDPLLKIIAFRKIKFLELMLLENLN